MHVEDFYTFSYCKEDSTVLRDVQANIKEKIFVLGRNLHGSFIAQCIKIRKNQYKELLYI